MTLISKDNKTKKFLVNIDKDTAVETTYVNDKNKHIVCFSSMAGCPVGCNFCVSGKGDTFRKLSVSEMLVQCHTALAHKNVDDKPILFSCMGEGEPFLNYKNVIEVLKELGSMYDNSKLALSTTGIKPHLLAELGKEKFPVPFKLQISIHSTSEAVRRQLMPQAPTLGDIEKYLPLYLESGNALEYNYVLLDGINDADNDAVWLSVFAKDTKIKLNMLNPIPGTSFKFTDRLEQFCRRLDEMGATYEFYATDGTDIDAACGQMSYKVRLGKTDKK